MDSSSRTSFYDLFKLIVALILLLIFLFLFFWMPPSGARQFVSNLATITSQPSLPILVPSVTSVPLTETSAPTIPSTPMPRETPLPTPTSTSVPSPTPSPIPERTPTPGAATSEETNACETVLPSQLQIGMQAVILRRLNFRSSPGISNNWLLTNPPGTQVQIIGGAACTRYKGGGTYRWWQIKLPNGLVGWSAEASASGAFYFMEPIP